MSRKASIPTSDFYQHNTNLKWIVLGISILISIGSIYYTNVLVEQLKSRERQQVELFAHALEYTLNDESTDNILFITDEIIFKNNSIPTIWITREGQYQYRNIDIEKSWSEARKKRALEKEIADMKTLYEPIKMTYREKGVVEDYGYVYGQGPGDRGDPLRSRC